MCYVVAYVVLAFISLRTSTMFHLSHLTHLTYSNNRQSQPSFPSPLPTETNATRTSTMPIVWCAQQLIFEGSPASIARIIKLVSAVKYPSRDMGVIPHQQIASRIGAKEEALLWRRNRMASDADATSDAEADAQEQQANQGLDRSSSQRHRSYSRRRVFL